MNLSDVTMGFRRLLDWPKTGQFGAVANGRAKGRHGWNLHNAKRVGQTREMQRRIRQNTPKWERGVDGSWQRL